MKEIIGPYIPNPKLAETHMHTIYGDGKLNAERIVDIAIANNLSVLAITEHDQITPAVKARDYVYKNGLPIEIAVGTEITTLSGHLIALFVEDEIPRGRSLEATIEDIHKKGGLAILAHPKYRALKTADPEELLSMSSSLDGFEVFNAALNFRRPEANTQAQNFYLNNRDKLGAPIGCSDGHFYTLGQGLTGFEGNFRQAIEEKRTIALSREPLEQLEILEKSIRIFGETAVTSNPRIRHYLRKLISNGHDREVKTKAQKILSYF